MATLKQELRTKQREFDWCRKIATYIWDNRENIIRLQKEAMTRNSPASFQKNCFHDDPEAFLPMSIYKHMSGDIVDSINEFLHNICLSKVPKMTERGLVTAIFKYF